MAPIEGELSRHGSPTQSDVQDFRVDHYKSTELDTIVGDIPLYIRDLDSSAYIILEAEPETTIEKRDKDGNLVKNITDHLGVQVVEILTSGQSVEISNTTYTLKAKKL